jgi:hypothetical protein
MSETRLDWRTLLAERLRTQWMGIAGLTAALVGAALIALVVVIVIIRLQPLKFDSATWKSSPAMDARSSMHDRRQRMADDFLAAHNPIGWTRHQVLDKLGPDDDTQYFRQYYDLVYFLGPERGGFPIDSEWLVIKFTNDVVTEAQLVTD